MLKDEIEIAKRSVNTDTVQVTIGELSNMYSNRELNILPDFQRLFRWSVEKKSNFIESILIGIPIPPVFAYENSDGTWELIDGLQRISTILEFMGILRAVDSDDLLYSKLMQAKYLPSLKDVVWEAHNENEVSIDKSLQLFFRRSRVDFQVLKHPSDVKTKYDLFQRLNRGGAYANEQEVRTCSMVLANSEFVTSIRQFCSQIQFERLFSLNQDQKKVQKDIEYATRLIVHTFRDFSNNLDVQEFLDHSIVDILANDNMNLVMETVSWSVSTLHRLMGDRALFPPDGAPEDVAPRFSLRALEAIAAGIARNRDAILQLAAPDQFILEKVRTFWNQPEIAQMSASGLRGTVRLQRSVPFGAQWFSPNA